MGWVSGALYDVEFWLARLNGEHGDSIQAQEHTWFSHHVVYLIPLICPDGYEALWGHRLLSTLHPQGPSRMSWKSA